MIDESLRYAGRLMFEDDYLTLANAMVGNTNVAACRFRLENPAPGYLTLVVEHDEPIKALIAATLMKEMWPYDWMPVNAAIKFRVAV